MADLRGAQGTHAPTSGPKFLHFHAVFRKNWSNNRLAPPPPLGLAHPPLENPRSATVCGSNLGVLELDILLGFCHTVLIGYHYFYYWPQYFCIQIQEFWIQLLLLVSTTRTISLSVLTDTGISDSILLSEYVAASCQITVWLQMFHLFSKMNIWGIYSHLPDVFCTTINQPFQVWFDER